MDTVTYRHNGRSKWQIQTCWGPKQREAWRP